MSKSNKMGSGPSAKFRPNIIIISLVPLRQDHLPSYGYHHQTMPSVDLFGKSAIQFDNAYSTGAWTPPAHASTLTGLFPSRHGVLGSGKLFPEVKTLPEVLKENGYRTCGVVNTAHMGAFKGLDRGFDEFSQFGGLRNATLGLYRSDSLLPSLARQAGFLKKDKGSRKTAEFALNWLRNNNDKESPFFLLVHFHQAHHPYDPRRRHHAPFLPKNNPDVNWKKVNRISRNPHLHLSATESLSDDEILAMKSLYDGELKALDELYLAPIFNQIDALEDRENTIVVVTSPHGENLGDHALSTHVGCLYNTLIKVPLFIRFPKKLASNVRSDALVQLVDLFPSLLSLADISPTQSELDGQDIFADPEHIAARPYAFAEWAGGGFDDDLLPEGEKLYAARPDAIQNIKRPRRAVVVDGMKLIDCSDATTELYDLMQDPGETRNVANQRPNELKKLQRTLTKIVANFDKKVDRPDDGVMSDDIRDELRDLGYRI